MDAGMQDGLHQAVRSDDDRAVSEMLRSAEWSTAALNAALNEAALHDCAQVTQSLMDAKARPCSGIRSGSHVTPLKTASKAGNVNVLKVMAEFPHSDRRVRAALRVAKNADVARVLKCEKRELVLMRPQPFPAPDVTCCILESLDRRAREYFLHDRFRYVELLHIVEDATRAARKHGCKDPGDAQQFAHHVALLQEFSAKYTPEYMIL